MKFTGELSAADQARVTRCDHVLYDEKRLAALRRTGLMDTPAEEAFDRLAKMAARLVKAPLTLISFVSDEKQFFKAAHGLPANSSRSVPLDGSICRYTLHGEPFIVEDAATDPFLMHHPATRPWQITAFLALPMVSSEGHVLGAFCAVDHIKRTWSEDDISTLRELAASVMTEVELRIQVNALQVQRAQRERLVAAITHDLRTPITAALLSATQIARKSADASPTNTVAMRIVRSMQRADQMISDLLDASRIAEGESLSLNMQDCDLQAIVETAIADLSLLHGARFVVNASPCPVQCDPKALRRVLENLVSNAVKYGSADKPITVTVARRSDAATLAVHNLGAAIAVDEQARIFESYQRAPDSNQKHQIGWGIGLGLVRALLQAHGGDIAVRSSLEEGTTFTALLPDSR